MPGFNSAQMRRIEQMQASFASIDEIAKEMGMHRSSLLRKMLLHHQIVIEPVRACRLVPLAEYQARQVPKQASDTADSSFATAAAPSA
jgi:hypothetical protein